jgi:hypothetical protein
LLKPSDLKNWVHRDFSDTDKLLLVLSTLDAPTQVKEIKARCKEVGLRKLADVNVSSYLARTKGLAINTSAGWELTDGGKQHLHKLGVSSIRPAAVQVATGLRGLLAKITDADTRAFVEEAVQCYEYELYRSAVVMSWLAAVHVLKLEVLDKHLKDLNAEASRVDAKWKMAKTTDDLGRMNEADFLDRLSGISMIGKNVKEQLQACLKMRNACGHPNSFKLGEPTVSHHIDVLMRNVFNVYC